MYEGRILADLPAEAEATSRRSGLLMAGADGGRRRDRDATVTERSFGMAGFGRRRS